MGIAPRSGLSGWLRSRSRLVFQRNRREWEVPSDKVKAARISKSQGPISLDYLGTEERITRTGSPE